MTLIKAGAREIEETMLNRKSILLVLACCVGAAMVMVKTGTE